MGLDEGAHLVAFFVDAEVVEHEDWPGRSAREEAGTQVGARGGRPVGVLSRASANG